MIIQSLIIERIITVSITQIWPIFYLSIFAYKLLKRAKNRTTITLSTFFILLASAYLFAIFSILLIDTPLSYPIYVTTWYLLMVSHWFFILFCWLLLKIEGNTSFIKYIILLIPYIIVISFIIWFGIFVDGIQYDSGTGWRPVFSLSFAIMNWMYVIFFLIIPEILMSFKLLKIFRGSKVVIRIKLFLISSFLEFLVIILLILYNTILDNQEYRSILAFINFPLGMLAAYFIYRSFGKKIE